MALKSALEQFESIISQVDKINENVQNLATTVEQQSAASEEIASSMDTSSRSVLEASKQLEQIKRCNERGGKRSGREWQDCRRFECYCRQITRFCFAVQI